MVNDFWTISSLAEANISTIRDYSEIDYSE